MPNTIDPISARGGVMLGRMRYVLGISMLLAIIGLGGVWYVMS